MSTGERSCEEYGYCKRPAPTVANKEHCDVDCEDYKWDGKTEPDTKKQ